MGNLSRGTGFDDPLDLLSSGKKGTGSQVHRLLDEYDFSRTTEVGDDSDELKIRTFFKNEENIIDHFTFFARHIEPDDMKKYVMIYISLSSEVLEEFRKIEESPYHTLKNIYYLIEKHNLTPRDADSVIRFYFGFEDAEITEDVSAIISQS